MGTLRNSQHNPTALLSAASPALLQSACSLGDSCGSTTSACLCQSPNMCSNKVCKVGRPPPSACSQHAPHACSSCEAPTLQSSWVHCCAMHRPSLLSAPRCAVLCYAVLQQATCPTTTTATYTCGTTSGTCACASTKSCDPADKRCKVSKSLSGRLCLAGEMQEQHVPSGLPLCSHRECELFEPGLESNPGPVTQWGLVGRIVTHSELLSPYAVDLRAQPVLLRVPVRVAECLCERSVQGKCLSKCSPDYKGKLRSGGLAQRGACNAGAFSKVTVCAQATGPMPPTCRATCSCRCATHSRP